MKTFLLIKIFLLSLIIVMPSFSVNMEILKNGKFTYYKMKFIVGVKSKLNKQLKKIKRKNLSTIFSFGSS